MKIAINGFGRIGRAAFKIALKNDLEVVGINDLTDTKTLAYLIKHDTVYRLYKKSVDFDEENLIVDGKKYKVYSQKDPSQLPWKELEVDVVLECTGVFRDKESCQKHIDAGAKKVIISAPAKSDDISTYVLGVNEEKYKGEDIIDMASCTTNCIAPVVKIIHERFGVKKALMSTIHAYTADQNLVDGPHKDLRRARTAGQNIIPTTTGAAKSTTKTIPELQNKFDGMAMRVPVACGSLADITFLLEKSVTKEEINNAITEEANKPEMKNVIIGMLDEMVSSDVIGNSFSSIVDLHLTQVVDGDLVKIIAWYDNEWGYANRLVEMAEMIMNVNKS